MKAVGAPQNLLSAADSEKMYSLLWRVHDAPFSNFPIKSGEYSSLWECMFDQDKIDENIFKYLKIFYVKIRWYQMDKVLNEMK